MYGGRVGASLEAGFQIRKGLWVRCKGECFVNIGGWLGGEWEMSGL
jgi:hypothetical protein